MKRTDITDLFPGATPEQIDTLIGINGADIENAKKDYANIVSKLNNANAEVIRLQAGIPTANDLKAEKERADKLQAQVDAYVKSENLRNLRGKVAREKGIPAELLTAETEEACTSQADAILAFANQSSYPALRDNGELGKPSEANTSKQFADWFSKTI